MAIEQIVIGVATSIAGNLVTQVLRGSRTARAEHASDSRREALQRCLAEGAQAFCCSLAASAPGRAEDVAKSAAAFLEKGHVEDHLVRVVLRREPELDSLWDRFLDFVDAPQHRTLIALVPEPAFAAAWRALDRAYAQARALEEETGGAPQEAERTRAQQAAADGIREGNQTLREIAGAPPEELLKRYLHHLIARTGEVDVAAVDREWQYVEEGDQRRQLRIADVFTSLPLDSVVRTDKAAMPGDENDRMRWAMVRGKRGEPAGEDGEEQDAPPTAVEAVARFRRLVILGRPGSGKTTLVRHLSTQLALRRLGSSQGVVDLPGWPVDEEPIPVYIVLRELVARLPEDAGEGHSGLVWDFLRNHALPRLGCGECYGALKEALDRPVGVVFFDGLDEVGYRADVSQRGVIMGAVRDFARAFPGRVVVTSRGYAYRREDGWRLPEELFPVAVLGAFADGQIGSFAKAWYAITRHSKGWDADKAEVEAEHLAQTVRERGGVLREMAGTPLLLTMIVQVHARGLGLPTNRAALYARISRLMLESWENRIAREQTAARTHDQGQIASLGLSADALRRVLEHVAFNAHEAQERLEQGGEVDDPRAADIPRDMLVGALVNALGRDVDPEDVIHYFECRAGLLGDEDNRTYSFCHRSFQEFFAAQYIQRQPNPAGMLAERLTPEHGDWWHEVYLLAAGSYRDFPKDVRDLVEAASGEALARVTLANVTGLLLGAQAMVETNFTRYATDPGSGLKPFRDLLTNVRRSLVKAASAKRGPKAAQRVQAGRVLAELGDPRFDPDHWCLPVGKDLGFILIPAGRFFLGSDASDPDASEDETPGEWTDILGYDCCMGALPVTNAQFTEFVRDGGYAHASYWREAEQAGRWTNSKLQTRTFSFKSGRFDEGQSAGPADFGEPFSLPSHPVVGVCWYESLAYCRWLDGHLRHSEDTPPALRELLDHGYHVTLPSEAEWEKAARGSVDQRHYPWGDEPDPDRANCNRTAIDASSAVGCFPRGASPYGCLDMAGNVWEWTRSLYGTWDSEKGEHRAVHGYPYVRDDGRERLDAGDDVSRVLRGGSWDFTTTYARCAIRLRYNPYYRLVLIGFRVCLSPFQSSGD